MKHQIQALLLRLNASAVAIEARLLPDERRRRRVTIGTPRFWRDPESEHPGWKAVSKPFAILVVSLYSQSTRNSVRRLTFRGAGRRVE